MRLKEEQIGRLADQILNTLVSTDLITLKKERGAAANAVRAAIAANIAEEAALEKDAERLLDQTLKSMGSGAAGIDRHKMHRMIKEKLAKDRKIVL